MKAQPEKDTQQSQPKPMTGPQMPPSPRANVAFAALDVVRAVGALLQRAVDVARHWRQNLAPNGLAMPPALFGVPPAEPREVPVRVTACTTRKNS